MQNPHNSSGKVIPLFFADMSLLHWSSYVGWHRLRTPSKILKTMMLGACPNTTSIRIALFAADGHDKVTL